MGKNLAERYSTEVDESFSVESRAVEIVNEDSAKWDGVETVNVYSMPVAPLHEYDENSLTNVYGTPMILERNLQKMTVKQKPTFSFRIRRLDKNSDMMASEAGQALSRQISRMVIPQYDHYVFSVAAHEAQANGNAQIGVKPTKNNVYEMFLAGMENLGNAMAPDRGRIAVRLGKNLLITQSRLRMERKRSRQSRSPQRNTRNMRLPVRRSSATSSVSCFLSRKSLTHSVNPSRKVRSRQKRHVASLRRGARSQAFCAARA